MIGGNSPELLVLSREMSAKLDERGLEGLSFVFEKLGPVFSISYFYYYNVFVVMLWCV